MARLRLNILSALSVATAVSITATTPTATPATASNVLILDHFNYNHRKGDHTLLKAFFFDLLGLTPDPRKQENIDAGKGTVWANMAAHQFHLAEGKPDPQVLDGVLTLGYSSLDGVRARLAAGVPAELTASAFSASELADGRRGLALTDPWGTPFHVLEGVADDARSKQDNGEDAEARCLLDVTFRLPKATPPRRLAGIGRFYEQVLGCRVAALDDSKVVVAMGGPDRASGEPCQSLTYAAVSDKEAVQHEDLGQDDEGRPLNRGAHISLYLDDLRGAYRRADALGLVYVNHRFKRRAYNEEEAVEQCMFRTLDIVDPEDVAAGPIVCVEHEVRSATRADGTKYKSCPLQQV